jgi:hypothetical protein
VTCQQEFAEGDPAIHSALRHFEDMCLCEACVTAFQKGRAKPEPVQA